MGEVGEIVVVIPLVEVQRGIFGFRSHRICLY